MKYKDLHGKEALIGDGIKGLSNWTVNVHDQFFTSLLDKAGVSLDDDVKPHRGMVTLYGQRKATGYLVGGMTIDYEVTVYVN